jgi:membrane-associated phospholipid phosphatase
MPSGHSSASQVISIVLILDVFHGHERQIKFYSNKAYIAAIIVCLFWSATIPYTRFLLGVHSLDQIIYGITLGIWAGLTLHFIVRDHLIEHVERLIKMY